MGRQVATPLLRRIELDGQAIDYRLRHTRRRTVGLRIDDAGLRVAAPLRMSQARVDAFLRDHRGWVLDTLAQWAARPQPARIVLTDGACFPLFGAPCRIVVRSGRQAARWAHMDDGGERLEVHCAAGQSVPRAVMKALRARALADFTARVARDAAHLGRPMPEVRLTNARTRWGSCSARAIRLNWRLAMLPEALVDYVVAHEVAHLVHMNHSPAFWAVVESLDPTAQAARRQLRELGQNLPELIESAPV